MSRIFGNHDVTISLQKISNFPSQVIQESLRSGVPVLSLNSGDTMLFGDLIGLTYFEENATPGFVLDLIIRCSHQVNQADRIIEAANERFEVKTYCENFMRSISSL